MTGLDTELSIGDVAQQTGLSVHALRFYEREGLMLSQHIPRGTGGHRRYTPMDVKWLVLCIKLRASGMPLGQIRRYAELVREGPGNEQERLDLLQQQQARVEQQLAELKECHRIITRKVGIYQQHLADGTTQDLWDVTHRANALNGLPEADRSVVANSSVRTPAIAATPATAEPDDD